MLSDEEKKAIETTKILIEYAGDNYIPKINREKLQIILNLIEKQNNIIDSTKRILYDEDLDYCDTLDELYHFYENIFNINY